MTKHHVTATIRDKSGRVLSKASNNYLRSHPIQASFAKRAGQPERIFLHAEIAALVKLRKGQQPHSIAIERYTRDDRPALAAPCAVCMAAIAHWKIKHISYTL